MSGGYLALCYKARSLGLTVKLGMEYGHDPAKDESRLSRLWVENRNGEEEGMAFLFARRESLDDAAELVLEQIRKEPA